MRVVWGLVEPQVGIRSGYQKSAEGLVAAGELAAFSVAVGIEAVRTDCEMFVFVPLATNSHNGCGWRENSSMGQLQGVRQ